MAVATPTLGDIDFVETPNFVFPMRPSLDSVQSSPIIRSPSSLSPLAHSRHGLQRKSASALPTFTFNSSDTSGLGVTMEPSMLSPPRGHGHRRGASELVGASGPFDFGPMSATPVKGHAHKRSAAVSITELPILPSPAKDRKVGFSEDVQIIPRPLSTVSTDSSGTITVTPIETIGAESCHDAEDAVVSTDEKEGQWLKCGIMDEDEDDEPPVKFARALAGPIRPPMGPRAKSEPGVVPTLKSAEPDLEALFQSDPFTVTDDVLGLDLPRLDLEQISNFRPRFDDDTISPSIQIDLDYALAPRSRKASRQLHSSRIQSTFRGRAASAPLLARFEGQNDQAQSMADVFEEDEDMPDCIEIVAAEDDPRECLEAKLQLARPALDIPLSATASLMTPTTYAASTFSTPDITHPATCASSMTDKTSSALDVPLDRVSVEVPSLTSTRSTISRKLQRPRPIDKEERRRKRSSIHSLTKFVLGNEAQATWPGEDNLGPRKENRLGKLMFWKHRRPKVAQT